MDKRLIIGGVLSVSILALIIYILFFKKDAIFKKKKNINELLEKEKAKSQNPKTNIGAGAGYATGGNGSGYNAVAQNGGFPMGNGSYGNNVKIIQEKLKAAKFDVGAIDSSWGNRTTEALKNALAGKNSITSQSDFNNVVARLDAMVTNNGQSYVKSDSSQALYDNRYVKKTAYASFEIEARKEPFGGSGVAKTFKAGDKIGTLTGKFIKNGNATWYEYLQISFFSISPQIGWVYEGSFTAK
jgi:hypothetical protein